MSITLREVARYLGVVELVAHELEGRRGEERDHADRGGQCDESGAGDEPALVGLGRGQGASLSRVSRRAAEWSLGTERSDRLTAGAKAPR